MTIENTGEAMPRTVHDLLPGESFTLPASILTKKQVKKYGPRKCPAYGPNAQIMAEVRYDDECGNGHNSFAITADIYDPTKKGYNREIARGCCHDEIAAAFPELAPLIKWHLCNSDGPTHYPGNVTYLAGDRDCHGLAKGEVRSWDHGIRFADSPVTHPIKKSFADFIAGRLGTGAFQVVAIRHKTDFNTYGCHYTLIGYGEEWHDCPFRTAAAADEFCEALNRCKVEFVKVPALVSEGKDRELESARHCAVWPEATDAQLSLPKAELEALLLDRLPALVADFKRDVEALGFTF